MSGGGLASDGQSIYFMTGNGAYVFVKDVLDPENQVPNQPAPGNYPDSFVKLSIADLSVQSAYTDLRKQAEFASPYVFDEPGTAAAKRHTMFWARERSDADLGSGGIVLVGNRALGGGKDGRLYVLDTNGLAHVQSFQAFFNADTDEGTNTPYSLTYNYRTTWYAGPNIHGGPVAWMSARGFLRFLRPSSTRGRRRTPSNGSPSNAIAAPSSGRRRAMPQRRTRHRRHRVRSRARTAQCPAACFHCRPTASATASSGRRSKSPSPRHGSTVLSADRGTPPDCAGCVLSNGRFAEYRDATRGYVPDVCPRSAQTRTAVRAPLLWGDKRGGSPNNLIPRYSKFTPPTVAHGKIVVATGNDEIRFYGLRNCAASPSACATQPRRADDLVAPWNDAGSATFAMYASTKTNSRPTRSGTSGMAGGATTSAGSRGTSMATAAPTWRRSGTTPVEIR